MFYHLRRAKRDSEKKRQLVAKTSAADLTKVMDLVSNLSDAEPKPASTSAKGQELVTPKGDWKNFTSEVAGPQHPSRGPQQQ